VNLRAARKTLEEIQRRITCDTFEYAEFFPENPNAKASGNTFRELSQRWLDVQIISKATKANYQSSVNRWNEHLGDKNIRTIRLSDLREAVAKLSTTVCGSSVNNYMLALRGVYDLAQGDNIIPDNLALKLVAAKYQTPEPDPLDADERDAVLAHMAAKYAPEAGNYFEFAFCTGMRPSELIALRWGDIDWNHRTVTVQRAIVLNVEKSTKTNRVRDVHLTDRAIAALTRQKAATFMKGAEAFIFTNPATGEPWAGTKKQAATYWNPTLRALGMRARDAYQTRHTYATLGLMGGINVAYIARQMGHAKVAMTLNRYARWIDRADKGAEAQKLNALFNTRSNCPTIVPGERKTQ
jgi:integrase